MASSRSRFVRKNSSSRNTTGAAQHLTNFHRVTDFGFGNNQLNPSQREQPKRKTFPAYKKKDDNGNEVHHVDSGGPRLVCSRQCCRFFPGIVTGPCLPDSCKDGAFVHILVPSSSLWWSLLLGRHLAASSLSRWNESFQRQDSSKMILFLSQFQ